MRLYIIRHADPDYPNKTITKAGHLEAQALAQRLKKEGITRIYSSPMGRARHTMQYTADALGLPFEVEDWTRELEGLQADGVAGDNGAAWNFDGAQIRALKPRVQVEDWCGRPPFSSSAFATMYEGLKTSSDEFLTRHGYRRDGRVYRIEAANTDRLAVFCHGAFGLTWLAHLLELAVPMVWSGFLLAPSSVTTILFDERDSTTATPRCLGLSDTSHLYQAGLPIQRAGIVANFD